MTAIKFLLHWRGREPGQIVPVEDGGLSYGVADLLVIRGVAQWVEPVKAPSLVASAGAAIVEGLKTAAAPIMPKPRVRAR